MWTEGATVHQKMVPTKTQPAASDPFQTLLRPLWGALLATTQRLALARLERGSPGNRATTEARSGGGGHCGRWPGRSPVARCAAAGRPGEDRRRLVDEAASQVVGRPRVGQLDSGAQRLIDNDLVFVACSFNPDMDPIFDAVAAAATAVGLRAARVKDFHGDYRIMDRILSSIRAARLIVADLSGERPNVYFELGYARGLGKTVITIRRTSAVPHFDVQDWTCIEYIDSRPLEQQLQERFRLEIERSCRTTL
jgi:hypothetical protein